VDECAAVFMWVGFWNLLNSVLPTGLGREFGYAVVGMTLAVLTIVCLDDHSIRVSLSYFLTLVCLTFAVVHPRMSRATASRLNSGPFSELTLNTPFAARKSALLPGFKICEILAAMPNFPFLCRMTSFGVIPTRKLQSTCTVRRMAQQDYQNTDCTVYIGDLDQLVSEAILWELMLQAGPVGSNYLNLLSAGVHIPKDKVSNQHMGFGFVEFASEIDADYAIKIMNMVKLYGSPIRLSKATRGTQQKHQSDVGANLFIGKPFFLTAGNLDPMVDEKMLYDVFSAFGFIIHTPKVMRDPDSTSVQKNFGFVSYDSFDASDAAIQVQLAFKIRL
jgi:hypothetical protein